MKEVKRRQSKQLNAIWEIVKDESSHPTADQVYEKARSVVPNISLGTVYRNLQKLVSLEKLQVVTLGRTQRFDPMVERHEHFICEECGSVYDLLSYQKKKSVSFHTPKGFTVSSHQLSLYGTCKDCAT